MNTLYIHPSQSIPISIFIYLSAFLIPKSQSIYALFFIFFFIYLQSVRKNCPMGRLGFFSKLKTEEGYSADIYPNVRTMSAQHLTRNMCLFHREMLCGHSADIVRTYISKDICPHYILLRFSAQAFRSFSFIPTKNFCSIFVHKCSYLPNNVPNKRYEDFFLFNHSQS